MNQPSKKFLYTALWGSVFVVVAVSLIDYLSGRSIELSRLAFLPVFFVLIFFATWLENKYKQHRLGYAVLMSVFISVAVFMTRFMSRGEIDLLTIPTFLLIGIPILYLMRGNKRT